MMNGEKMMADRRPKGGAMSDQATNVIPFPRPHGGDPVCAGRPWPRSDFAGQVSPGDGKACGVGLTAGRFWAVP